MATQQKIDEAYMGCARSMATLSNAVRKKVGAIMVSGENIISDGVNGTPAGFDNCCEFELEQDTMGRVNSGDESKLVTKPEVLHAESNAIAKVAKSTNSSRGATLYITCSPCYECSKMIIQAGIKRVVYEEEYRLTEGLALLRKAKVAVEKLNVV